MKKYAVFFLPNRLQHNFFLCVVPDLYNAYNEIKIKIYTLNFNFVLLVVENKAIFLQESCEVTINFHFKLYTALSLPWKLNNVT